MVTAHDIRAAAARTARGSPSIEMGPYDGYLYEKPDGKWQAEAGGLVVGSGITRERAELLLSEHAAGHPLWLVTHGGTAELLKAAA